MKRAAQAPLRRRARVLHVADQVKPKPVPVVGRTHLGRGIEHLLPRMPGCDCREGGDYAPIAPKDPGECASMRDPGGIRRALTPAPLELLRHDVSSWLATQRDMCAGGTAPRQCDDREHASQRATNLYLDLRDSPASEIYDATIGRLRSRAVA